MPPSRQLVVPLADAVQAQRKPDPLFGGLENNKRRGLSGAELAQKLVVHHDLGDAAIGQAADKAGAADILIVEFEAKPRRQQHAQGRHHPPPTGYIMKSWRWLDLSSPIRANSRRINPAKDA